MRNLVIAEGQTEEKFLKALNKEKKCKVFFQFKRLNLMQKRLKYTNSIFYEKLGKVFFVVDASPLSKNEIDNFFFNCELFFERIDQVKIFILVQNLCFEDELKRALNVKSLKDIFKCRSEKDVKGQIIGCNNLINLLENNHINYSLMWTKHYILSEKAKQAKLKFIVGADFIKSKRRL